MSDVPTAESGPQPQTPPVTPEPQAPPATPPAPPAAPEPLTSERIAEFRRNRDSEGLTKAIADAQNPSQTPPAGTPPAPEAQQAPGTGLPPVEPGKSGEPKLFHIKFQGEDVELDDSDSYLGYGSFGKLKRAAAHQRKTLDDYGTRIVASESRAKTLEARIGELSTERDELQQRVESTPIAAPATPTPTPAAAGEPQTVLGDVEIPTPPAEPQYSSDDPLDWTAEDRAKDVEYRKERRKYDDDMRGVTTKLVEAMKKPLPSQQPGPYKNDPALVEQVEEQGQYIKGLKSADAKVAAERRLTDFWKDVAAFQDLHKEELSTSVPLQKLHEDVASWMNGLAWANGVTQPENATAEQMGEYEQKKAALVDQFLKGDQAVVEAAAARPPPDEYKQYFRIAGYQKRRAALVREGKLGDRATLQDAWEKDYVRTELDKDVAALEAGSRAEGSQAVLDSLGAGQRENASHIPNNAAAAQPPGTDEGAASDEISRDEALRILKLPIAELQANPELRRKRSLIVSRLKAT